MLRFSGRFTALLLVLFPAVAWPQQTQTLRESLQGTNVPVDSASPNLDRRITIGAALNDARQFVTAYYLAGDSGALDGPLFIDRFDRNSGKWQNGKLQGADGKLPEEAGDFCFGSVLAAHVLGDYLLLDTHINPSAGCSLVVSTRDLRLTGAVYGWFLAGIGPSRFIYQRSEVHFAAVHPAELALYDAATGHDVTIFPAKQDQPIRADLIKRMKAFFSTHQDWCNEHDHPCDTEQIDSELIGEVAVNAEQDALAFVISYETQVFQPDEVQVPSGPKAVLYVYRNVSDDAHREFREILLPDENTRKTAAGLALYLKPDRLAELFSGNTK